MGEVTDINTDERLEKLLDGSEVNYDYLIVATGATHSYFGKSEWAGMAPGLKTLEDALEIRRRVLTAFESAEGKAIEHGLAKHLNFVIIGGGPSGVELAEAISDIAKLYMTRDFRRIRPTEASVITLEGSSRVLGTYSDDLQKRAVEQLQAMKVEVRTDARVIDVQPCFVMVGQERNPSACTLSAAGITTISHLLNFDLAQAEGHFDRYGMRLHQLARGIHHSPVVPNRASKSISAEDTFERDIPYRVNIVSEHRGEWKSLLRVFTRAPWATTGKVRGGAPAFCRAPGAQGPEPEAGTIVYPLWLLKDHLAIIGQCTHRMRPVPIQSLVLITPFSSAEPEAIKGEVQEGERLLRLGGVGGRGGTVPLAAN